MQFVVDMRPFEEMTRRLDAAADQIPFALSRALNDAASETYEYLIEQTWPRSVKVRNQNFLRWALRTKWSTKFDLTVEIDDVKQRGHLSLHDQGGQKLPKKTFLAIPTRNVRKNPTGSVAGADKPRALARSFVRGNKLFQRDRTGRKVRLMYILVPSITQPADVPFTTDFRSELLRQAEKHFPQRMREAMKTRR